jgi:hypothetical protein
MMVTIDKKPRGFGALAASIYPTLQSEARPATRPTAQGQSPEQAKASLDKFLKEAAERAKRR